jgi:hypothetical protein
MRIVHIQERLRDNGAVERLSSSFEQGEILIGRGGRCHLIITGRLVSLEHARISFADGVWTVSDLNSLSGLRINNTRTASAVLSGGDTLLLGEHEFVVSINGAELTLLQRVRENDAHSAEVDFPAQSKRLSIDSYLPRMRTISLILSGIVLVGYAILPFARGRYDSLSSGPLSNAHKMIERDCRKCHSTAFSAVQDKECLSCHVMSDHAKDYPSFVSQHAELDMRCADCHMEHNRDEGLVVRDSRLCQGCHEGMKGLKPGTELLDVGHLADHPQFRVEIRDADGRQRRVPIDESATIKDHTALKFNHAVHLKRGLRGPQGAVDLQCNACHELDMDDRSIKPISFDRHCRDCHSLGFDERLPDVQLLHGSAEAIYPALLAEYAKLFTLNRGAAVETVQPSIRSMPSRPEQVDTKDMSPDAMKVEQAARVAEEEVFTRTGCFLCHNYEEKNGEAQSAEQTRYLITKPNVPTQWLAKAQFHHGAHDTISCESCHENIRKSTETTDLSLPGIETCRSCHVQEERPGYVRSDCAQCHMYHEELEVPVQYKKGLSEYLHSLTR